MNGDAIGADELLHQPHQLGEQHFATASPIMFHLVEYVAGRFKDDALGTKLARQPLQLDAVDFGHVGLALQDRG